MSKNRLFGLSVAISLVFVGGAANAAQCTPGKPCASQRPQVLPQASADPSAINYSPSGQPMPVRMIPLGVPQSSNVCYVSFSPPGGCVINGYGPTGAQCYCVDQGGNPYYGILWQ